MTFAPDIVASLKSVVNLLNTEVQIVDMLSTVADLDEFLDAENFEGSRAHNQAELRSIRQLRSQLKGVWTGSEEEAVFKVNQILRNANAQPQLVKSEKLGYHLHATTTSTPLYDRLAVDAAMALAEVIRSGGIERLRICASADCRNALLDLSRNRSKLYCDIGNCANREHVRAYRARKAGKSSW
ncbi:CGNR zinc finger domain-containing protein [Glutamicibacter sp. JL.03c]|uniref:CGNR zinc finger domain-containing protein n=1 Tax=Glutamicibacter sp. JL.03c TaxID=2984842 RepID=UPI0021F7209A|nr:CGNR zinc finger domain-containing protein [Glutamicibacter sp. JL.03c]UYQ77199.1 CGNR zinc finger domain-containing protein [Glutamicibacter sp. JL.03c]